MLRVSRSPHDQDDHKPRDDDSHDEDDDTFSREAFPSGRLHRLGRCTSGVNHLLVRSLGVRRCCSADVTDDLGVVDPGAGDSPRGTDLALGVHTDPGAAHSY